MKSIQGLLNSLRKDLLEQHCLLPNQIHTSQTSIFELIKSISHPNACYPFNKLTLLFKMVSQPFKSSSQLYLSKSRFNNTRFDP